MAGAVACVHAEPKTVPDRRFRRGVSLRRPLPRPGSPRRAPAHPRPARGLRRLAVDREGRRLEWRMLPHDFPPWEAVYQQTQRWLAAGVFETIVHDLRVLLRLGEGRNKEPTDRKSVV